MSEETPTYADAEAAAADAMMADIEATPDTPAAPAAPATPDQPEATPQESFTNVDPATLEGEAAELYKSMQADYTQKTQEIAAYRELGYDPQTLQQAVDFTSRLTSDPNYAAEVVEELYELVKESGIDPFADKFAEAPDPLEDDLAGVTPPEADPYGIEPEVNPQVQQQLSALTNELEGLKQAESERREAVEIQELQLQLDRQEAEIVAANPSYGENDISMIHRLAWSTEGDLLAANELYQQNIQHNAGNYLDQKAKGAAQPGTPSTGQYSEPPQSFDTLDDPQLEELALLRLQQALEEG